MPMLFFNIWYSPPHCSFDHDTGISFAYKRDGKLRRGARSRMHQTHGFQGYGFAVPTPHMQHVAV